MKLPILAYERSLVGKPCQPVERDKIPELAPLIADMYQTMDANAGVGLAAPQVGKFVQLAVIGFKHPTGMSRTALINPQIVDKSDVMEYGFEACLSLPIANVRPDSTVRVPRHCWVRVQFYDEKGEECMIQADGMFARIVQHEIDHLSGKFYIDYLSPLKRSLIVGKHNKLMARV